MAPQRTFASLAWSTKGKVTRRERFLAEMDQVIPWEPLLALIAPHYPQAGRGRRPVGLETMLRIYFVQQWFNLSDPQAEDALYDSEAIRRFVGVELGDDVVPDETTILRFRHLLERHQLTAALFEAIRGHLEARQLLLKTGTIVDATIIHAPSSTKNATATRDPEMRQTRQGKQWYFGMKLHIGTDPRGVVHHVVATDAATADITQLPALLHGEERDLYGDQAYWKEEHRQHWRLAGGRYRVNRRGTKHRPLTASQKAINRSRSRHRARGEHPFHVVKRLWGFTKVRYRGVAKNLARALTMFGLANLYRVRRHLLPPGWEPVLA
jgi:IS5 family transposase